ncbi:hypothetical protein [Cryptosporangium phraense]|uniref:Uncharacterized protein n=1 Tax=Cryptosporangium phraense TaxID=2593070 RepID=A0A545AIU9_9ACTN|nr:hypothetical protein [Cryptosporangium phraense]TQS41246.1 hypothetical protein FL583_30470 [Cryptosporangium phraense]
MIDLRPEQGGRGRGIAAAIEGGFAACWFGWAQAEPPGWLVPLLIVGAVLSGALAVGGVVLAVRSPSGSSPMAVARTRTQYYVTVAIEVVLIWAGSALLGATGHDEYIAAWIALVVGVHFVPLGRFFGEPLLQISGVVISLVAIGAAVVALATDSGSSTVAGTGTGLALLVTGVLTLFGVRAPN